MTEIGLGHYLTLGAIIFSIGIIGIFLNRKNIIVILMSIELILLAVNINLVSFSIFLGDLTGQVFTLFILTVAATESSIGLSILSAYYKLKQKHYLLKYLAYTNTEAQKLNIKISKYYTKEAQTQIYLWILVPAPIYDTSFAPIICRGIYKCTRFVGAIWCKFSIIT